MERLQKHFWVTVGLLVFLTDPGFGFFIIEGPSNFTALVGMEARFNCTVSEGWPVLIWLFEGQPVLTVTYPGKAIITDKTYSQQGYNKSTEFTSELIIHNVQRNNSGKIECNLQSMTASQYAFLSVQESDTNEDGQIRTIILAVVLSIVGFILLLLIILLIVCCWKRRKESNYPKEMQKVSMTKKAGGQNAETMKDGGNENYGYTPEELKHTNPTPRVTPFSPVDSGLGQDSAMGSTSEVSHDGNYERVLPSRTAPYPINPRKIRNVTHV